MTTPGPIRAALERLHQYAETFPEHDTDEIVAAARAALDASEVDGPTDKNVEAAAQRIYEAMRFERVETTPAWAERGNSFAQNAAREAARDVLTHWGHPATTPAPAAGDAGDVGGFKNLLAVGGGCGGGLRLSPDQCRHLGALLERLNAQALQPVPVSERLPDAEDCDAAGKCWFFDPCDHGWWWLRPALIIDNDPEPLTHWLPVHALPLPTTTPTGQERTDG